MAWSRVRQQSLSMHHRHDYPPVVAPGQLVVRCQTVGPASDDAAISRDETGLK